MSDLLIRGGTLVDGSGAPARRADVLVSDGRIAAVAEEIAPERAASRFDASGMVVCPGFVDIHRHPDRRMLADWDGEIELRQGITTVVAGNCGLSLAPASPAFAKEQYEFLEPVMGAEGANPPATFPGYMAALAAKKLPLNAAAMIGTGSVRASIKGYGDRPFTPRELDAARALIDEALASGATGVSMGVMYVPECYNSDDDYAAMLSPLGRRGGRLTAHIRGEGDSLVESVREAIALSDRVGCALEISHFKSCGRANWRREIYRAIDEIEQARARGRDVGCDFYPYDGGSTGLSSMIPPAFLEGDMKRALSRLGTAAGVDAFRKSVHARHPGWDNYALIVGWDRVVVSGVAAPENARFVGLSVQEAAGRFGFQDAEACAAHILSADEGRTAIISMSMCADDIDAVARLPYACVISDALYSGASAPHPRLYGAFPKILRDFVRERKVLALEDAIHKMTALPASRLGIRGRGLVREGNWADLLAFDLGKFRDRAEYARPAQLAEGLALALVNGEVALREDQIVRRDLGAPIRRDWI